MPQKPEGLSEDLAKAMAVNANGLDTARKSIDHAPAVSAGNLCLYSGRSESRREAEPFGQGASTLGGTLPEPGPCSTAGG
jgi:hypothetical protein